MNEEETYEKSSPD